MPLALDPKDLDAAGAAAEEVLSSDLYSKDKIRLLILTFHCRKGGRSESSEESAMMVDMGRQQFYALVALRVGGKPYDTHYYMLPCE